ncbi:MAG: sporulation protein YqfC [Peptococcaceae bacterium]|jgi:sporulation protein YqfC|nr:sporulation protein YqfC [Peptococcaceae bacterium]
MAEEKTGRIGRLLDMSKDAVLHLPRISLFGNLQCCVENHQGVVQYTQKKIGLNAGRYRIYIEGEDLVITSLSADAIYVEGRIGQVQYEV